MAGRKNVASNVPQVKEKQVYKCVCCGQEKHKEREYYKSNSIILRSNDQRMVVCKQCVLDLYGSLVIKYENTKIALYFLCRLLDIYFDVNLYPSVEIQANNSGSNIAAIYLQKINSLNQYGSKTFIDSTSIDLGGEKNIFEIGQSIELSEEDKRNKEDVIRMVGYDPFENENPMDKKYLYNTLVDFLDESTLEDSFKLPIVIEIVKSFNQLDKFNQALTLMTNDINNVQNQAGGVKSLIETKDKIYRAILAMAKDNGISVNHATNKSKGAGTLSGIIKQLQERGFNEVEVNLFDIETAKGIQQVSDLSSQAIIKQLMMDENDYTWMISEQREMIQKQEKRLIELEEENRLLKIHFRKNSGEDINE